MRVRDTVMVSDTDFDGGGILVGVGGGVRLRVNVAVISDVMVHVSVSVRMSDFVPGIFKDLVLVMMVLFDRVVEKDMVFVRQLGYRPTNPGAHV